MSVAVPDHRDLLSRAEAAAYVEQRTGIPTSAGSLAARAVKGTGPRYTLWGGSKGGWGRPAMYRKTDLDLWIEERMNGTAPACRS